MRALGLLLLCLAAACSGGSARPDAAGAGPDAGAADAPATPDAAEPDVPSSLGRLCATTAADGGPGSCPDGVCCASGGTTICTLPSDCPTGQGYRGCEHTSDCQGAICCHLPSMQFCTKGTVCDAYGGTVVP